MFVANQGLAGFDAFLTNYIKLWKIKEIFVLLPNKQIKD
jgi:hypothetical protein